MEDAFFKSAFSNVRVIEFLLRSQVPEWADKVDYSSLQRLSGEFVDDKLRHRYADSVWRGRSLDARTEYMLVLEFQGRPERHMALRTTVYSGLAVQELLRHDKTLASGERVLAVACLVLHHGDRRWNAPTRLRDLLRSKGMSSEELEEATTMQTVVTAFERSLDEIRQEGREEGIELGRVSVLRQLAARKFGPAVAEEFVRLLDRTPDPERVARVTEALLDCNAADDFVKRVREG